METRIISSNISVIVQGPICYVNGGTKRTCESIRKYLPYSQIIVSTWEGEDTTALCADDIVFSKPPSSNMIIMPHSDIAKLNSVNHQLISVNAGLKKVKHDFVLKIRSDCYLSGNGFLKYYKKFFAPKERNKNFSIFDHHVCVLPTFNVRKKYGDYPFNVCDWVQFGSKQDISKLFSIDLWDTYSLKIRCGEKLPRVDDNMGVEQYIWLACIGKYFSNVAIKNAHDLSGNNIAESEAFLANNFILLPSNFFCVKSMKYSGGSYIGPPWKNVSIYSFFEWELLYKKYSNKKYFPTHFLNELQYLFLNPIYLLYILLKFHRLDF